MTKLLPLLLLLLLLCGCRSYSYRAADGTAVNVTVLLSSADAESIEARRAADQSVELKIGKLSQQDQGAAVLMELVKRIPVTP